METNNEKKARYIEARKELKELSKAAKLLVKEGAFDTVNEAIIESVYKNDEHQIFKKFWEWKKDGMMIKKGSKGFPVWTAPIDVPKDENKNDNGEENETYWGICYLFSNAQVHSRQQEPAQVN